jgi:hypothetical protein
VVVVRFPRRLEVPYTKKGKKVLGSMEKTYGSRKKAKTVMHKMKASGKISGVCGKKKTKK